MRDGEALSPQPPPASTSVSLEFPLSPQRGRRTMLTARRVLAALAAAALCASSAAGYSFNFTSSAQQCRDFSVVITGQGSPPYTLLLLPVGPSTKTHLPTLATFNTTTSISITLKYPGLTQLVAVVSSYSNIPPSYTYALSIW